MKKSRVLIAVLTLALCVSWFLLQSSEVKAAQVASGSCGNGLMWVLNDDGVLTISGSGEMYDYTQVSNPTPWDSRKSTITSVVVEEGVTTIGTYAFSNFTMLSSVKLPKSLKSIGAAAFDNCVSLTSVTVPEGVTKIGNYAFNCCSALVSAKLPYGLKRIPDSMFNGCRSLAVVIVPKSVYEIGRDAFENCYSLWHVLFTGSEKQWKKITIYPGFSDSGFRLESATLHYNCDGDEVSDLINKVCSICSGNCSHKWNSGKIIKEPTCTEDGAIKYTCGKCEKTKTESIDAIGHDYSSKITAPTCTEEGYTTYACSRCGETTMEDYTDATGHNWDDGVVSKEPTEIFAGERLFTCGTCGDTRTEEMPMLEPAPTEPTEPSPTKPIEQIPVDSKPIVPSTQPDLEPSVPSNSNSIMIIVIAVVLITVCCAAVLILMKKKK